MPQRVPQQAGGNPAGGLTRRAFPQHKYGAGGSSRCGVCGREGTRLGPDQDIARPRMDKLRSGCRCSQRPAGSLSFGKGAGVKVTLEHINANDLPARATAAIEGRKGPDIMQLLYNNPRTFTPVVWKITMQLLAELGGKKFYPFIRDAVTADGVVRGVPYFFGGGANTYRKDIFQKAGIDKTPRYLGRATSQPVKLKSLVCPLARRWGIRSAMHQVLPIPCSGPWRHGS